MRRRLAIRADGSGAMGLGHVMRCIALGQAWRRRGGDLVFCTAEAGGPIRNRLEAEGFSVRAWPASHPDPRDLESLEHEVCGGPAVSALVLDGYHFDSVYQRAAVGFGIPVLIVDDLAQHQSYHCDILLNQNLGAEGLEYRVDPDTRLLLGPRYSLIRDEFLTWKSRSRDVPGVANRVLVTLGGGDPEGATEKVVRALQRMAVPDLEVRVIIGSAFAAGERMEALVDRGGVGWELLRDVRDMPRWLAWADLAVAGAGSTCWELAFMGLPSLLLEVARNQRATAQEMDRSGAALNLGWHENVTEERLALEVAMLREDEERRRQMVSLGRTIVDGDGAARVAEALEDRVGSAILAQREQEQRP